MRIERYIALGLAWFSLASCVAARLARAEGGDRMDAAATDPLGKVNRLPAALERTVGLFRADLDSKGFAVARGYWTLWGVEDCKYPIRTIGYCYGNNPTAPYALAMVPTWKDEYVDRRFHHLVNEGLRNMTAIHRLDGREAMVIVAQMPPPARYFGIGSNVFTKKAAFNPDDPIIDFVANDPQLQDILFGVSPDPERRMLVSSIGQSTNNVMIKEQTQSSPWDRPAYFVIASDADMEADMRAALVQAGAQSSEIFTETVSPFLVKLGLRRSADDLITYIRYSMPVDKRAGEKWRKELPLAVLRVRDMSDRTYNNPLPLPSYAVRSHNANENLLATDLANLKRAVAESWAQPNADTILFFSAYKQLDLIGQHCLGTLGAGRGPMDCLGDSQDADYQISMSGKLDKNLVIAVMGTLSTETGNATYTSLSVNWFPELVGVASIDDPELKGSAAAFASAVSDPNKFYVYYVARNCAGLTHCREISKQLVPTGGTVKLIQRNYINPGSTSGPDPDYMLNPVAIVLDGRNRPSKP